MAAAILLTLSSDQNGKNTHLKDLVCDDLKTVQFNYIVYHLHYSVFELLLF